MQEVFQILQKRLEEIYTYSSNFLVRTEQIQKEEVRHPHGSPRKQSEQSRHVTKHDPLRWVRSQHPLHHMSREWTSIGRLTTLRSPPPLFDCPLKFFVQLPILLPQFLHRRIPEIPSDCPRNHQNDVDPKRPQLHSKGVRERMYGGFAGAVRPCPRCRDPANNAPDVNYGPATSTSHVGDNLLDQSQLAQGVDLPSSSGHVQGKLREWADAPYAGIVQRNINPPVLGDDALHGRRSALIARDIEP